MKGLLIDIESQIGQIYAQEIVWREKHLPSRCGANSLLGWRIREGTHSTEYSVKILRISMEHTRPP